MADKDLVNEKKLSDSLSGIVPTDPSTDGSYVLQNDISSGASSKSWELNGIVTINAPSSTTLTTDEFNILTSGKIVKINGTFLNRKDPVLFANNNVEGYSNIYYLGYMIGAGPGNDSQCFVDIYHIDPNTKIITIHKTVLDYSMRASNELLFYAGDVTATRYLRAPSGFTLKGKSFPSYSQGYLYYNGSAMSWASGGTKLYKHTLSGTVSIGSTALNLYGFSITTNSATQLSSASDFWSAVNNGIRSSACLVSCSLFTGYAQILYADDYSTILSNGTSAWGSIDSVNFTDTVVEL